MIIQRHKIWRFHVYALEYVRHSRRPSWRLIQYMSTLSWLSHGYTGLFRWLVSRLSAAQWETLSFIWHLDDFLCLQESLSDCRQGRLVPMRQAFDDLDLP